MEDEDSLEEFFRVLGLRATRDILHTIHEGNNQYKDFMKFGCISTINLRPKQLESLGIIEHNLTREEKRREWYTLTEKGERVMKVIIELEKAFQGE
jgi:DNA-binding HxlR family transcriptional regulator